MNDISHEREREPKNKNPEKIKPSGQCYSLIPICRAFIFTTKSPEFVYFTETLSLSLSLFVSKFDKIANASLFVLKSTIFL